MPVPRPTQHRDRRPLRDRVYATLLDDIVSGRLAPGTELSDADLAERLGVSRTPIREAIDRLAALDLVHVRPRRWTQVSPLDVDQAYDALDVHSTLDSHVLVHVVPRLTSGDRAAVRRYLDGPLGDPTTFASDVPRGLLERDLFSVLYGRFGNDVMARAHAALMPTVRRFLVARAPTVDLAATRAALRRTTQAILDGDGAAAAHELRGWATGLFPAAFSPRRADPDAGPERPAPRPDGTVDPAELPRSLGVRAARQLREAILDGTLEPGEDLREQELMDWLEVSRTPLRVALAQLELGGLVEHIPHRSTRVATLDAERAADTAELLQVLHRRSVELAVPRLTPVRTARLAAAADVVEAAVREGDRRTAAAFLVHHSGLVDDATGNRVLVRATDRLRPAVQRALVLAPTDDALRRGARSLRALQTALENGDVAAARAAVTPPTVVGRRPVDHGQAATSSVE